MVCALQNTSEIKLLTFCLQTSLILHLAVLPKYAIFTISSGCDLSGLTHHYFYHIYSAIIFEMHIRSVPTSTTEGFNRCPPPPPIPPSDSCVLLCHHTSSHWPIAYSIMASQLLTSIAIPYWTALIRVPSQHIFQVKLERTVCLVNSR